MHKKFAIFGDPVEHSLSPLIHNATFTALGADANYYKIHLQDGSRLKETFFQEKLSGANITVPHKEAAYGASDYLDPFAKKVGAVNTLVLKNGKLYGYNTDAPGFLRSIAKFDAIKSILILGAGGTTRATSVILRDAGYKVSILNRSQKRLESFIDQGFDCYTFESFPASSYDLIVNMTSAGLKDSNLPTPESILKPLLKNAKAAVDIIYGKETPFLKLAKSYNLPTNDGKDMLVAQAVLAFDYFTEQQYDLKKVESVMKRAIDQESVKPIKKKNPRV